jgi:hypothetical protein
LNEKKTTVEKLESEKETKNKISRRDFLKYGVGVAAVAAGATAFMGKISLPAEQHSIPSTNDSAEPIVVAVTGDQLTVMSAHVSAKVRDAGLAALISQKLREGV